MRQLPTGLKGWLAFGVTAIVLVLELLGVFPTADPPEPRSDEGRAIAEAVDAILADIDTTDDYAEGVAEAMIPHVCELGALSPDGAIHDALVKICEVASN